MNAFPQQSLDDASLDHDLHQSAMLKLAEHFHSLATGASQVPSQSLDSHLKSQIDDPQVLEYHDRLLAGAGPLFSHFLASVPYVLEELSRIGVTLSRLVSAYPPRAGQRYSIFEVDAFDGSNGRALAGQSQGLILSLTSSPNRANQIAFERYADPALSHFYPHSFFKMNTKLLQKPEYKAFSQGFDFIYEMAAFQFYNRNRAQQIAHIKRFLKPSGLAFFLEKLNHPDSEEYLRREKIKDEVFKTRYFKVEEIRWKRQQMLVQMQNGQVTMEELVGALSARFKHVHLLWNSSNFCEFVASDDEQRIERFLKLLGPVVQPPGFCFEGSRLGSVVLHGNQVEVPANV
ncbi:MULTISPECIES: class I SAM-dependent methyltransferase [Pseudomonas]|uniref:Class I SAM-dependent methyltransferase n=1 Tax=Pseudomonas putida TaxID=303 RepID=A0AAW5HHS9_PSEPU|nr:MULTISPECIES: class I SAM-dependent methyltransferase [Pseudomonas]MBP2271918.1 SAM-dependent methyltransferase [Pseudomonas sp. BP6]MBP2289111.1 SAM-dependent methyltransferase [Pseudomonas sp. BP7]MCO1620669.1 class I SAM-dependent methyltransferase [Pseudomonas putida]HDS1695277.1 class I SAM-dependent methyltransferase [Pseudomonas putida]HDS1700447.1 class I SAM-dependent methyltransferase [Pseudomonas putida]